MNRSLKYKPSVEQTKRKKKLDTKTYEYEWIPKFPLDEYKSCLETSTNVRQNDKKTQI